METKSKEGREMKTNILEAFDKARDESERQMAILKSLVADLALKNGMHESEKVKGTFYKKFGESWVSMTACTSGGEGVIKIAWVRCYKTTFGPNSFGSNTIVSNIQDAYRELNEKFAIFNKD
jgi:hypothetical protein